MGATRRQEKPERKIPKRHDNVVRIELKVSKDEKKMIQKIMEWEADSRLGVAISMTEAIRICIRRNWEEGVRKQTKSHKAG